MVMLSEPPPPPVPVPAGWEGILDSGETILWQGKPSGKLRLEFRTPLEVGSHLFFTGFSVFWMVMASKAPGPFWMFGLLFFGIGIYNLLLVHFWKAFERTQSHLTLTNKRAIIATAVMGRRTLKNYPISRATKLELVDAPLGSIFFATKEIKGEGSTTLVPIGFEMIENTRAVFALFRQVQENQP